MKTNNNKSKSSLNTISKWNAILEKFWLVVAIAITTLSIIIGFIDKWNGVSTYFLLSGLSWGVYLVRRGLRKHLEKKQDS
jgi:hypothetical protein